MIDINKIHEGTVVYTEGNRKRVVSYYDGKNIHFKDGAVYGWRHPGLTSIEETLVEDEEDMRGWTVAALKTYCSEHEIPCKGCKTKTDYINAIGVIPPVDRISED